MRQSKYAILGGGMVAGYAAKEMVERGLKEGELAIISSDNAVPYERPPLSKGFLAGKDPEENIRINAQEFYQERGIELRLNTEVTGVDARRRVLRLGSGDELAFDKLIVATGARVRKLELADVLYLRSLDDSKRIRERAGQAKRAVVIGAGFIGMEVASVLAQKGIATTMVFPDDRIWSRLFTPAMSKFFEGYYTARGVEFRKQTRAEQLDQEMLKSAMVVAGIGVTPVTELLANSGIEVADGVLVDEFLETNQPGIYAAGDVAHYQDTLFGKRRRVEHWDNAVSQGQHCARALLGERAAFVHVPYFFSDVFDLSYEFWGDHSGADQTIERGDLATNSFSVWWLRQERLVAAFTMNRPDEEREAAQRWIASKERVGAERLRSARLEG